MIGVLTAYTLGGLIHLLLLLALIILLIEVLDRYNVLWAKKSSSCERERSDDVHEVEQSMDALAREYTVTHDPKIIAQLKDLSRVLRAWEIVMQLYNGYFIEGTALLIHPGGGECFLCLGADPANNFCWTFMPREV